MARGPRARLTVSPPNVTVRPCTTSGPSAVSRPRTHRIEVRCSIDGPDQGPHAEPFGHDRADPQVPEQAGRDRRRPQRRSLPPKGLHDDTVEAELGRCRDQVRQPPAPM